MSDPFFEKTTNFIKELKESEKKEDYENALLIINKAISFIEGFSTNEKNPNMTWNYTNYLGLWNVLKRTVEINKKIHPIMSDANARSNNLESRIKRLEEQFEKIKNWQDKQDGK